MGTLWIREYSAVPRVLSSRSGFQSFAGNAPMAQEPGTDQEPVTFSTSAQSAAFATGTRFVAITSDVAFHYVVGDDPEATTDALRIPADTLIFIGVAEGWKIAAIEAA